MKNLIHIVVLLSIAALFGCGEPNRNSQGEASASVSADASASRTASLAVNSISIGDKIDDARKVLDAFGKDNSVGGFAFGKRAEDVENIFVQLDPNHMNACIWYSKSSRVIDRMSVVCFPNRRNARVSQAWIAVQSMQFGDDGTHTIQFRKPLTLAELEAREAEAARNRPQSQIPTGNSFKRDTD